MIDTLPGFLIVAGLVLFVFSLFRQTITIGDHSIPTFPEETKPIVWILSVIMLGVGSYLYYTGKILPLSPPIKKILWTIQPNECQLLLDDGIRGAKSGQVGSLELRINGKSGTGSVVCKLPQSLAASKSLVLRTGGGSIYWGNHGGTGGALRVGVASASTPKEAVSQSKKWPSNWNKAVSESSDIIEPGALAEIDNIPSTAYVVLSFTSSWGSRELLLRLANVRIEEQ